MADYQVTCITPDGNDADRRIDRLGGPGWNDSIDKVIGFIKSGSHRFYVSVGGLAVWVVVRRHSNGREYLTTEGDGFPPNNLLNLPHC